MDNVHFASREELFHAVNIVNFEDRKFCKEINGEAWGYIEYDRFLTDAELNDYELKKGRRESQ